MPGIANHFRSRIRSTRAIQMAAGAILLAGCTATAPEDAAQTVAAAGPEPVTAVCADLHWDKFLSIRPQTAELVEEFDWGGNRVQALRLSAPAGPVAKIFMFNRHDGDCIAESVSFGTYEATTALDRARGTIGEDERLYHGDIYRSPRWHGTIYIRETPPTYEESRDLARRIYDGGPPVPLASFSSWSTRR